MVAFTSHYSAGVAGSVSRANLAHVDTVELAADMPYGAPGKFNATGQVAAIAASDAATVFAGIVARTAPKMVGTAPGASFGAGTASAAEPQGFLRKGYCHVICAVGTPVKGGTVYMRVTAASGKAVGDLEATADSSNSVALVGVEWAVNGVDDNKVTEILIK